MKKYSRDSYLVLIIVVILILAVVAVVFMRYLEDQTRSTVEVSTYLNVENSSSVDASEETSSTSEADKDTEKSPVAVTSSANDILQLLSQSINHPDDVSIFYNQFTTQQVDGTSQEEYEVYVALLRDIIGQNVEAYSTMSYSDARLIQEDILAHDPNYKDFLENASFHWLEYTVNGEVQRLPIILSKIDGKTYLSNEWIRGCLELKNFSVLYFGALLDRNFETLYGLTYSATLDDETRLDKTNELLAYYDKNIDYDKIKSQFIKSIHLDSVSFSIPEKPSDNIDENVDTAPDEVKSNQESEATSYHDVTIYKQQDKFIPIDYVPNNEWKQDALVYKTEDDSKVLKIGDTLNLKTITDKLGNNSSEYLNHIEFADDTFKDYYSLVYKDIEVNLELKDSTVSDIKPETEFVVVGFKLKTTKYNLANEYKVGQSLADLLDKYLYIDTLDYAYIDSNDNYVDLKLDEDTDTVDVIEVKSKDYKLNLSLYGQEDREEVNIIK